MSRQVRRRQDAKMTLLLSIDGSALGAPVPERHEAHIQLVDDVLRTIRSTDSGATIVRLSDESVKPSLFAIRLSEATVRNQAQEGQVVLLSKSGISLPFRNDYAHLFATYGDSDDIFSSGERVMLTHEALLRMPVPNGLSSRPWNSSVRVLGDWLPTKAVTLTPLHDTDHLKTLREAFLHSHDQIVQKPAVKGVAPAPEGSAFTWLLQSLQRALTVTAPLDDIRDYFGESIAFYFAFETVYTQWLMYPSLMGVAVWLWNGYGAAWWASGTKVTPAAGSPPGSNQHHLAPYTVPATVILGLLLAVWTTMFLKSWRRHQSPLAYAWATLGSSTMEPPRPGASKPPPGARTVYNPVTGQAEQVESALDRMKLFMTHTLPVMFTVLSVGILALFLNEQLRHVLALAVEQAGEAAAQQAATKAGATLQAAKRAAAAMHQHHVESVADHLEDVLQFFGIKLGGTASKLLPLHPEQLVPLVLAVPAFVRPHLKLLHTVGVQLITRTLLGLGRYAAEWTTERENPRTESAYAASLVAKLVLITAVVNFGPLLYIAFVEQDLGLLGQRVVFAFAWGPIISLLVETGLPVLKQRLAKRAMSGTKEGSEQGRGRGDSSAYDREAEVAGVGSGAGIISSGKGQNASDSFASSAVVQTQLGSYDPYDDYEEMFVQFGYVALFTPLFPLAPLLAWLNNLIEGKADAVKLCALQRPVPHKTAGLGAWNNAFEAMGYASVLVNAGLIGVATAAEGWPPGLSPLARTLMVLFVEHAVLALKALLEAQVSDVPHDVHMRVLHEAFLRPQLVTNALRRKDKGANVVGTNGAVGVQALRQSSAELLAEARISPSASRAASPAPPAPTRMSTMAAMDLGSAAVTAGMVGSGIAAGPAIGAGVGLSVDIPGKAGTSTGMSTGQGNEWEESSVAGSSASSTMQEATGLRQRARRVTPRAAAKAAAASKGRSRSPSTSSRASRNGAGSRSRSTSMVRG